MKHPLASQRLSRTLLLAGILAGLAVMPVRPTSAEEENASLASLPEVVRKTAEPLLKGAVIEEVEPTFEDGAKAFEVEYKKGDVEMAIVLSPEGKLILTEERLSLGQTPEKIAAAVAREHVGSKITAIKKIEKVEPKAEYYKVSVKTEAGKVEKLNLNSDGSKLK